MDLEQIISDPVLSLASELSSELLQILEQARMGDRGVIWNTAFQAYVFSSYSLASSLPSHEGSIPALVLSLLASNPGSPYLEGDRYASFSGHQEHDGRHRGFIWIDCKSYRYQTLFSVRQATGLGLSKLSIICGRDLHCENLPGPALTALHRWLLTDPTETIADVEIYLNSGQLLVLTPEGLGLSKGTTITSLNRIGERRKR